MTTDGAIRELAHSLDGPVSDTGRVQHVSAAALSVVLDEVRRLRAAVGQLVQYLDLRGGDAESER